MIRALSLALGAAVALALTAPAPTRAAEPVTAPAAKPPTTPAAEPVTVLLDWLVNPDHAALVVGVERGFFAAQGLAVSLTAPADPNDPPKLLAAGQADLAITYQPQLHLQVDAGLPVVRIATLVATPLNTVVALDQGPVKTLADLKGRKIGYSVGGFEDALLATMLGSAGVTLEQTTLINVNFALTPALMSGQVDAVIGTFRNVEVNQLALDGHPARVFYPEEAGVPPYDELVLIARRDRLGDPRLPRFVDGLEQAVLWLANHPEDGWQSFIKGRSELDDALNRKAWADTLPRLAHSPGALDPRRYQRFAHYLQGRGLIKTVPPLADYAVTLP